MSQGHHTTSKYACPECDGRSFHYAYEFQNARPDDKRRLCANCCTEFVAVAADPAPSIVTADGATIHVGERLYDYYSMAEGILATAPDDTGWFYVTHMRGGRELLNGERVCSLAHARRMGWPL